MSDVRLTESERAALVVAFGEVAGRYAVNRGSGSGPMVWTLTLNQMPTILDDSITPAVERILAARLADRDAAGVEARVRALADVLGQHQRLVSQPGDPCWCGTWPDAEHDTTWMEHVAVAQVAALSGPADEHPADGTGA